MADNKSKENNLLQGLNDRLAEYINKIKNQAVSQQEHELPSIHDLIEEKMSELWRKVNQEKVTTEELETYRKRFEDEKKRRLHAEKQVDDLITEKVKAELDRDFQKKRNELLKEEIKSLKDIYEKKIRELQSSRQQDLTETDASTVELKKVLQQMRLQERRITLDKQKQKMEDMEKQFKTMIKNLTGYEDALNNKLNLKTEIENYEMLLEEMEDRIDLKGGPSANTEPPKTPEDGKRQQDPKGLNKEPKAAQKN